MRLLFGQRAEELKEKIHHVGRESYFVNDNAALDDTRQEAVQELARRMVDPPGTLRVLMHSLAFDALKPLAGAEEVINRHQLELTADVMGHPLVYLVQACLKAGLMDRGARIFAMTSIGGSRAVPNYGPVSAAKATLEAHIRQLAVELVPAGITGIAILAGVTDTNALRQIPGYEKIMEVARQRNPNRRLTQPRMWRAVSRPCAIRPPIGSLAIRCM